MAKAAKIKIDFSKEEEGGGGRVRLPEGDYRVKITGVKPETSQAGNPMLVWTLQITEGKYKGKKLTDRTALTPKALWRVRALLEALGISPPKKLVSLDPAKLIGKELGVTLTDDEYEGKINSKVSDFLDLDTLTGDDVEDDEDEDDDDEDDDSDDEESDDDEEELDELDLDEM